VPPMVLTTLPFDMALLRVTICLFLSSALWKRLFGLDEREILSVDSDVNESTSLWWIKPGLPWIGPTTIEVWSLLGDVICQSIHKKHLSVRSTGVVLA